MSRDIEDIVHAPEYPEVSLIVPLGAVTGEIEVGAIRPFREISLHVTLVVPPYGAQHRWPRAGKRKQSSANGNDVPFYIEQLCGISGESLRRASWLRRRDTGKW